MFFSAQIYFSVHKYVFRCTNIFSSAQIYFSGNKNIFQSTNIFFSAQMYISLHKYACQCTKYVSLHKYIFQYTNLFFSAEMYFTVHKFVSQCTKLFLEPNGLKGPKDTGTRMSLRPGRVVCHAFITNRSQSIKSSQQETCVFRCL